MSANRYPTDLVITAQDFRTCGWGEALAGAACDDYRSMWQALSAAAKLAMDEDRKPHGKAMWLVADACSMTLSPKSSNEPFRPIIVMEGTRSAIPDDFSKADISFFAQIVDGIDDPWLRARLADLVWLKQRPRDVRFALGAIDAYRTIPLDTKTWTRGGGECWERGIGLARMLRAGAGDRLREMEATILAAFNAATYGDGFVARWLADLLASYGLGLNSRAPVAQKLETLARTFDLSGELHRAREYFRASRDWYKEAGDGAKSAEMTVALAEGWAKEAAARLSSEDPSHLVASTFYENAIQIYRTIPRSERAVHRVNERIGELRTLLSESGGRSLDEVGEIRSSGVDISQLAEDARNAVRNKEPVGALVAFASLGPGTNATRLREDAITRLRNHPLLSLFPGTVLSRDGRVIAQQPGLSSSTTPSDGDEVLIRSEMIRDYGIQVSIAVQGRILPALEVLLLEHRLRESDFVDLAHQSPIVPKGRERLFGKALVAGYDRDFVTAIHLLVPQIEHMVRSHLKQAGATTTTLDSAGIESENGLSTLMELPEAKTVFGEDLSFEFNALLCDAFGPNLRNELAHGLLDHQACRSVYAIYSWWLGLKLVFRTYWSVMKQSADAETEGDGA